MYGVWFAITWVLAFVIGYIYAIYEYGFLLGGGLGWIPAAIVATVAAALWPLVALAIALAMIIGVILIIRS